MQVFLPHTFNSIGRRNLKAAVWCNVLCAVLNHYCCLHRRKFSNNISIGINRDALVIIIQYYRQIFPWCYRILHVLKTFAQAGLSKKEIVRIYLYVACRLVDPERDIPVIVLCGESSRVDPSSLDADRVQNI